MSSGGKGGEAKAHVAWRENIMYSYHSYIDSSISARNSINLAWPRIAYTRSRWRAAPFSKRASGVRAAARSARLRARRSDHRICHLGARKRRVSSDRGMTAA